MMTPVSSNNNKLKWLTTFATINGFIFILICLPLLSSIFMSSSLFQNGSPIPLNQYTYFAVVSFTVINYCSYFFSLALFLGLACLILFFLPRTIFILLVSLIYAIAAIYLVSDYLIFSIYKFHINKTLLVNFFHLSFLTTLSTIEIISIVLLTGLSFFLQIWLSKIVENYHHKLSIKKLVYIALFSFGSLFSCFKLISISLSNHDMIFAHKTIILPLYKKAYALYYPQKNLSDYTQKRPYRYSVLKKKMHYPLQAIHCHKPDFPYNIIMVMVDTLRYDSFNPNEMPNTFTYLDKFQIYSNHWSGGNSTEAGLFSLFYSLPSSYLPHITAEKLPSILSQKLLEYGYKLKTFWGYTPEYPDFRKNIYLQYDVYSSFSQEGSYSMLENDKKAIQHFNQFIRKKQNAPFLAQLFLGSVHDYCQVKPLSTRFTPSISHCMRMFKRTQKDKNAYYNRYRNVVHALDKQLHRSFKIFDKYNLWENSIIIITSDHGEEFYDENSHYFGHASAYTKYQLQVPFLLYWPHKANKTITKKTSHYDFVPTILKDLFKCREDASKYSSGFSLFTPHQQPFLVAGSYVNQAIVTATQIILLNSDGDFVVQDEKGNNTPQKKIPPNLFEHSIHLLTKFYQ